MIFVFFQGKPFNITVIQVYARTSNAEVAEVERFYARELPSGYQLISQQKLFRPEGNGMIYLK